MLDVCSHNIFDCNVAFSIRVSSEHKLALNKILTMLLRKIVTIMSTLLSQTLKYINENRPVRLILHHYLFPKRSQELNKTIRSNLYKSTPYIMCVCLIPNRFGTYFCDLFLVVNRGTSKKIHCA